MLKRKYVPDLSDFMRSCELNYARLLKLLPEEIKHAMAHFQADNGQYLAVRIVDVAPYTTTAELILDFDPDSNSSWLGRQKMVVCLYHDASVAEVRQYARFRNLKPVYPWPNPDMLQPDEKAQLNQLLSDWLCFWLRHGRLCDPIHGFPAGTVSPSGK